MRIHRAIFLAFVVAALASIFVLPCSAQSKGKEKQDDVWTEGEQKGPRRGPPEFAPPPEGDQKGPRRGPPEFELTDEEINQIMKGLKERDPARAKELAELREKDPERFKGELRRQGGEEFGKIMKERMESSWRKRRAEFIEWLGKNYSKGADELAKLKDKEPELYLKKYNILRDRYWHIFEEEKRDPEFARVLKEDLELKQRQYELLRAIKAAKNDSQRKGLTADLEAVVSRRYDLIVKQKEIMYERLLKWLEELKNRVKESKAEIKKWQDEEFKVENVKKRLKDLTEGTPRFEWD
jgi:hypothetical protein